MAAPETIQPLVDKYTFHHDAYIRGQEKYNEAQLRQDFTDPFFHALGWDVNNNKGHSEAYREVLHGEPIRIRGTMVRTGILELQGTRKAARYILNLIRHQRTPENNSGSHDEKA
jgi:hypothetical protein